MSSAAAPWRSSAAMTSTATVNYTVPPAFIPVRARRKLAQPPDPTPTPSDVPPSVPSQPTERKRMEWPPAVRQYVQRCFVHEDQILGVSRAEMESKLKQVITEAAERNMLERIDWDLLPLPQVMIANERNKLLTNPSVAYLGQNNHEVVTRVDLANENRQKKRKSTENPLDEPDGTPPWRKVMAGNPLEDRVAYSPPDKRQRLDLNSSKISSKSKASLELRKKRFEDNRYSPRSNYQEDSPTPGILQGPIVGRCLDLEKRYFRLTAAPNPDTVRPLPVLEKTLDLLKRKWRKENNYGYICDQFKSLRQDLTVQHIRTDFTVNVYEIHARIALEKGDLGEYNQCQTQLRALYSQNLGGHPTEFRAYRILYFIYTRNQTAMNDALADLTPTDKSDPAVKHALDVRSALALGNYHRFFQLYLDTPNMGAYLMDMFVDRERLSALSCICKAYKPDVNIRFITEELGFESDEQSARFLLDHGSEELLEEREETVRLLTGKAGRIFEDAKADAYKIVDIKGQI